jgi:hypothetical protein
MTLTTGVDHSGRKYSTMRSAVPRFRPNTAPDTAHLGPGYVVPELAKPCVALLVSRGWLCRCFRYCRWCGW